jgi:peptidoglycan hydrolase-like protein with peptidoglycan-binding domain
VARGSGFTQPDGSERVRDLQRRLGQLGYRPGPVDGLFGPRTAASLRWFQYKHGLRRTGEANRATITVLRARSEHRPLPAGTDATRTGDESGSGRDEAGRDESGAARDEARGDESGVARDEARGDESGAARDEAGQAETAIATRDDSGSVGDIVLLVLAALVALVAGLLVGTHGPDPFRRRASQPAPEPAQLPRPRRTPVFGYVTRNSPLNVETAIGAVVALCDRRGWELVRIVHDPAPASGRIVDRAGLMYALREIRAGAASGLVVARLPDVAGHFGDLAALVQWLTDAEAFFAAAGRELDTSTSTGRATADAIIELGTKNGGPIIPVPSHPGRVRPPVVDRELAPRLTALRERGIPLGAIADALNVARIPTATGHHHWRLADVRAVTHIERGS